MEEKVDQFQNQNLGLNNRPNPVQNPSLGKINPPRFKDLKMIILVVVVVLAGILTGWLISGGKGKSTALKTQGPSSVNSSQEAGVSDESTFRDSAQGILREGGANGEGTHHLERDGGPSQNVYLTSSVIDLGAFVGKKVQVWGETISAAKAGWLMDVGKVKVIE